MSGRDRIEATIRDAEARTLAIRFVAVTPRTAADVGEEAYRLLGHKPRKCAAGLIWSDVIDMVAVLATESPTYAAGLRRAIAAAAADPDTIAHWAPLNLQRAG